MRISWRRLVVSGARALRDFVINVLAPITESREFKALYPILVISLGVLAASQANRWRTVFYTVAFLLIAVSSIAVIYQDAKKLRLENRWNLLFFSYYRPFLIELAKKIARSLDRREMIDTLTYRTDDLIVALDEAAPDFAQVSGERMVNIASFDIEYVPVLRDGIRRDADEYRLVPLSEFWEGRELDTLRDSISTEIRTSVLQLIDGTQLAALPVGWGLTGVSIIEQERLPNRAVMDALSRAHDGVDGFDFDLLFKNVETIRGLGYTVLLYDFWSSVAQLVVLNYTGHMTISAAEEKQVEGAFRTIRQILPAADTIADPVVLLDRVRASEKSIVIGGSTWFGLAGNLLPIAVDGALPVYGAFCECLGVLSTPKPEFGGQWEHDAFELMSWFAKELGGDGLAGIVPAGRRAIIQNYMPALLPTGRGYGTKGGLSLRANQSMRTDTRASFKFRRFSDNDPAEIARMKALWDHTRTTG